ncbi:hypothetical protein FB45DRAFT_932212, partial [Roridomyces roridus]
MGAQPSLIAVNLASVALESCLYGSYLVLSITSLFIIFSRLSATSGSSGSGQRSKPRSILLSPVFLGAIGLLVPITGHWVLTVHRAFLAFTHAGTPTEFYVNSSDATAIAKNLFMSFTVIIAEAIVIHRLWIVWAHNVKVIILPIITVVGLFVCTIGLTHAVARMDGKVGLWINSSAMFPLFTNVYCTMLILWRLRQSWKLNMHTGGNTVAKSLFPILIESATLYMVWSIFFFITYQLNSNLQTTIMDCLPSITGIACALIHVRVGLGWAWAADRTGPGLGHGIHNSSATTPPFGIRITQTLGTTKTEETGPYELEDQGGSGNGTDTKQSELKF